MEDEARTASNKRQAVDDMLTAQPELSNREIARRCEVSHVMVGERRAHLNERVGEALAPSVTHAAPFISAPPAMPSDGRALMRALYRVLRDIDDDDTEEAFVATFNDRLEAAEAMRQMRAKLTRLIVRAEQA